MSQYIAALSQKVHSLAEKAYCESAGGIQSQGMLYPIEA